MQGNVINFNLGEGKGVITEDDKQRYQFATSDWKEVDAPRRGDRVDFVRVPLARHFNVSVLGVRISMVLLGFLFLILLILYIVLWLILPTNPLS